MQLSTCPWRPIGKSIFTKAPWTFEHTPDIKYIPTEMSEKNMKIGLAKAGEPELQYPEHLVRKAEIYVAQKLRSVWTDPVDSNVLTYREALNDLSLEKSPGYPYYYDCQDKLEALIKYGREIKQKVEDLLEGVDVPCFFSLTEKSELRPIEKVLAGKTRVFMASDMHHLLASIQLFGKQNEQLMDKRNLTPSTVGIQIPGPDFVSRLSSLGNQLHGGDVEGCDLRFKLRIARSIRNIRAPPGITARYRVVA
jgi:hypothetical protein